VIQSHLTAFNYRPTASNAPATGMFKYHRRLRAGDFQCRSWLDRDYRFPKRFRYPIPTHFCSVPGHRTHDILRQDFKCLTVFRQFTPLDRVPVRQSVRSTISPISAPQPLRTRRRKAFLCGHSRESTWPACMAPVHQPAKSSALAAPSHPQLIGFLHVFPSRVTHS
jgi:hypothetical protein